MIFICFTKVLFPLSPAPYDIIRKKKRVCNCCRDITIRGSTPDVGRDYSKNSQTLSAKFNNSYNEIADGFKKETTTCDLTNKMLILLDFI